MRLPFLIAMLMGAASVVSAQTVESARLIGQPLQYMKEGKLDGCGLRVIAMRPLGGNRIEASEVSVNMYVGGRAVVKGLAYAPIRAGADATREMRVVAAWIKAPGSTATAPLTPPIRGENGLTQLYITSLQSAADVLRAQRDGRALQLMVQRDGSDSQRILAGKVELPNGEASQLDQCLDELFQRSLDSTLKN